MHCPGCGEAVPEASRFCHVCGGAVDGSVGPVVVARGHGTEAGATTIEIETYLRSAILTTLCCCMPAGIVAIVYAAQVKGRAEAGDIAGAQQLSRKARLWCWISLGSGLVVGVLWSIANLLGQVDR